MRSARYKRSIYVIFSISVILILLASLTSYLNLLPAAVLGVAVFYFCVQPVVASRYPRLLCMDRCRIYPAAIRDLRAEGRLPQRCRRRTKQYANNRIESDHRHVKRRLRAMQRPRTLLAARRLIQGIEVLGSKRMNPAP